MLKADSPASHRLTLAKGVYSFRYFLLPMCIPNLLKLVFIMHSHTFESVNVGLPLQMTRPFVLASLYDILDMGTCQTDHDRKCPRSYSISMLTVLRVLRCVYCMTVSHCKLFN